MEDAEGRIGYGEVAPIAGFGVESLEDAEAWLQSLKGKWIEDVPKKLPCCGFALSGALAWISGNLGLIETKSLETAGLLPSGESSISTQEALIARGFKTFKWKIGVGKTEEELKIAENLVSKGKLRLDANGSLNKACLEKWLQWIQKTENIEFIEQPLSPGNWRTAQEMAKKMGMEKKIALDEEVATNEQIARMLENGFEGKVVIKSALTGWIEGEQLKDAIHSSALETAVGKETALRLAVGSTHAVGFGVGDLFEEDELESHSSGPQISVGSIGTEEFEKVWETISSC